MHGHLLQPGTLTTLDNETNYDDYYKLLTGEARSRRTCCSTLPTPPTGHLPCFYDSSATSGQTLPT